jgi:ABC-type nitrate/sulfonate/bicarbonate transport system ATPase subunit
MATIEFDNVSKRFDDGTLAVDGLSLKIEDGEFMIFVGPSGCGKTTALRMVAGLEEISAGDIRIDGKPVNHLEPQDRDVAMVPELCSIRTCSAGNIGFLPCSTGRTRSTIGWEGRDAGIEGLLTVSHDFRPASARRVGRAIVPPAPS